MTSRGDIYTTIAGKCATVVGSANNVYDGKPEPFPDKSTPLIVIELEQPTEIEPLTFGPSGLTQETYKVAMWLVLGPKDYAPKRAHADQRQYADKFRAQFSNDHTLGGLCVYAQLKSGNDNLSTYRETGEYPQLTYYVEVWETKVNSAAAS